MSKKSVFCIATSRTQAEEIVDQDKNANFSNNDISVLFPDKGTTRDFAHEKGTKAPEGAVAGETQFRSNEPKRIFMSLALAVAAMCWHQDATAQGTINLGTADSFAILAGSQITDAGGVSSITGDVGLYPAAGAGIGLTPGQVHGGTIYKAETSGPLLNGAKNDLTTAYNDAAGRPVTIDFGVTDNQLGGKTLFPGVYRFGHAASANLIGTLTLDPHGSLNPVWIFQASSDFITAAGAPGTPGSSVALINGATACDVFWQVGSSATIGTYSAMVGEIMADQSITLGTGATLNGSALARIAAVTLDHNTITACVQVPEPGSALLLGSGLAILFAFRRRFFSSRRG
jgi:hypothetical protein